MRMHGFLDALPIWALFLSVLIVSLTSFETGFWIGRRRSHRSEKEQEMVVRGLVGGMLGLEAFMLAFTFGAAATHFDSRRQTILQEANAIKTAYLRADFLPEEHCAEIRHLLREYVDVRLEAIRFGKIERGIARSEELQNQLWNQAAAFKEMTPSPAFAVQLIQSLNEIINLHTRRVIVGTEFRIPNIIMLVLYAITSLAAASIGYHSGLTGQNRPLVGIAIILAFSAVIMLIEDLDRPMQGLLEVSQQALVDLQSRMYKDIH